MCVGDSVNISCYAAVLVEIVHHSVILEFDLPSYRTGAEACSLLAEGPVRPAQLHDRRAAESWDRGGATGKNR